MSTRWRYSDLRRFLEKGNEQAHEDGAVSFFRSVFGTAFKKGHREANGADGYVPGVLVAELKGAQTDWYSGFFQSLAYLKELDAVCILVACREFIGLWELDKISEKLTEAALEEKGAPSSIGPALAKRYKVERKNVLKSSIWCLESSSLKSGRETEFKTEVDILVDKINELGSNKKRERITPKNFLSHLKQLKDFFHKPTDAVTAFYDLLDIWTSNSVFQSHPKRDDCGSVSNKEFSIEIKGLKPNKRNLFSDFILSRCVTENIDEVRDFFSVYDKALDAVAPKYRRQNGIFFTDVHLARFALWCAREKISKTFGEKYLVLDPACGSGNLVSSWRSPLMMRHKVVSDIDPIHLHIVKKRLSLDADPYQRGHFTVVPDPSTGGSLNFIDKSAEEYLLELKKWLRKAGESTNRPIAILCNPPYRNDDDDSAERASYAPHPSLVELCGQASASDRLSMFLAQMKAICDAAEGMRLPTDSVLLLFTNSTWMTKRKEFVRLRELMMRTFQPAGGFLVNASEFFDTPNPWPLAFTMWKYSSDPGRDVSKPITLIDLTHLKKADLQSIPWTTDKVVKKDPPELERACKSVMEKGRPVHLGADRLPVDEWCGVHMRDFKRGRRKDEIGKVAVGGLPKGDRRLANKKAYGESCGAFVGFMDDLTPCRIKDDPGSAPWSRLNMAFADVGRARLLASRPDQKGYDHRPAARKTLTWYALSKVFCADDHKYQLWANQEEMWGAWPSDKPGPDAFIRLVFALSLADNECVETEFPVGNPVPDSPFVKVSNPLSLAKDSFWTTTLLKDPCWKQKSKNETAAKCIDQVKKVYEAWSKMFGAREELRAEYSKPYFIDEDPRLSKYCGILQIRHYAVAHKKLALLDSLSVLDGLIKDVKAEMHEWLTSNKKLDYFGRGAELAAVEFQRRKIALAMVSKDAKREKKKKAS